MDTAEPQRHGGRELDWERPREHHACGMCKHSRVMTLHPCFRVGCAHPEVSPRGEIIPIITARGDKYCGRTGLWWTAR